MTGTPPVRPRFGSECDQESSRLTRIFVESPTRILRGLFALAPRRRRSKVRWVLALGVLATLAGIGADRSTREFALSRASTYAALVGRGSATATPPAPASTESPTVTWPSAGAVRIAPPRSVAGGT